MNKEPRPLVSRHLFMTMAAIRNIIVAKSVIDVYTSPSLFILTTLPVFTATVSINHGNPRHINISNTLLPIELDTAISP